VGKAEAVQANKVSKAKVNRMVGFLFSEEPGEGCMYVLQPGWRDEVPKTRTNPPPRRPIRNAIDSAAYPNGKTASVKTV